MNLGRDDMEAIALVLAAANGHEEPGEYAKRAGELFDKLICTSQAAVDPPKVE